MGTISFCHIFVLDRLTVAYKLIFFMPLIVSFFLFCSLMFLQISPMWVTTGDLADSIMPAGELSNTVVEIGISVLQESCDTKKIIFPYILTEHLLQHKFESRVVQQNFRRDGKYKLNHKDLVCVSLTTYRRFD